VAKGRRSRGREVSHDRRRGYGAGRPPLPFSSFFSSGLVGAVVSVEVVVVVEPVLVALVLVDLVLGGVEVVEVVVTEEGVELALELLPPSLPPAITTIAITSPTITAIRQATNRRMLLRGSPPSVRISRVGSSCIP
jgi:hypothetical protein